MNLRPSKRPPYRLAGSGLRCTTGGSQSTRGATSSQRLPSCPQEHHKTDHAVETSHDDPRPETFLKRTCRIKALHPHGR